MFSRCMLCMLQGWCVHEDAQSRGEHAFGEPAAPLLKTYPVATGLTSSGLNGGVGKGGRCSLVVKKTGWRKAGLCCLMAGGGGACTCAYTGIAGSGCDDPSLRLTSPVHAVPGSLADVPC
ncbi:hypothetical protein BDZ85DRAFT_263426 [Elsinoe ampelina]|uniref:Uncharacterized protein n=1 Tax=Elsinoe ampelina TaxID=302913 RepID=A0A6A6G9P6_9PEZI|nr:hypothetical protein BDZ85DRAFT_263426 [Elsinoe ampelina]